jgi:nitrogen regulatory protein PII
MQTHKALRVEIIIEAPMRRRLEDAMLKAGVSGYTILPVLGGNGQSGRWSRDDAISAAGGLIAVICVIRPEAKDRLLEAAFGVLQRHIGIVSVSDCEVVRPERF